LDQGYADEMETLRRPKIWGSLPFGTVRMMADETRKQQAARANSGNILSFIVERGLNYGATDSLVSTPVQRVAVVPLVVAMPM
jgi:hypothetical protein